MQITKMKLSALVVAVCLTGALGGLALTGCNSVKAGESPDAPAVMKKGHDGRFETLGAAGCYGCHGYNSSGTTQLKGATAIPLDHLNVLTGDNAISAKSIKSDHQVCITCHVQGA